MPSNAHVVPLQGEANVGEGFCQRGKKKVDAKWCLEIGY
jgi:hypothetical protein